MDARTDIFKHRRYVAYILIVLGLFSLVFAIITVNTYFIVEEWVWSDDPLTIDLGFLTIHNPLRWFLFIPIIGSVIAPVKIATGFGILSGKHWAHILALILALFYLFDFPLGTAFAIYIFYAFLDDKAMATFGLRNGRKIENGDSPQ